MTSKYESKTLSEAQVRFYSDEPRLRGKRSDLLALLLDKQWHSNHECADVGGLSFHGSLHALRKQGWKIESRYLGPGRWMYKLTGKADPKQMNGEQRRIARAYAAAIESACGVGALESVVGQLPDWMRWNGNGI